MIQIVNYKNRVASRYLALTKEMIAYRVVETDAYWISLKLDGHFSGLHVLNGKATFYNRSGKSLVLPALEKEAERLFPEGEYLFVGELFVHDDAKRMRSFHVAEAVASPDKYDLRFTAFDIISTQQAPSLTIVQLEEQLKKLFANGKQLNAMTYQKVSSRKEIAEWFEKWVEQDGHEGLIIRTEEGHTYKVKQRHSFDGVIVGFSEGSEDQAGKIRNILVGMKYPDDVIQIVGKVGTGFSDEQRTELLQTFRGMLVDAEYIEVTERQTAFEFIRPELVVEFSCIDLLLEENGHPITKMSLSYEEGKGYAVNGQRPCVNMINPVFNGLRKDKTVDVQDVRFAQITDMVELITNSRDVASVMNTSKVIRKEVYVKETKGEKMVRKFLSWKTNKEQTGKYPAYVLAYTDYSPNRADKLQQELSIADTQERIDELFQQYIDENIKKGWEKII